MEHFQKIYTYPRNGFTKGPIDKTELEIGKWLEKRWFYETNSAQGKLSRLGSRVCRLRCFDPRRPP